MTKHPSYPVATSIRQKINVAAHEQGQKHEQALRAAWLGKVQSARDAGAGFEALHELVDALLAAPDGR